MAVRRAVRAAPAAVGAVAAHQQQQPAQASVRGARALRVIRAVATAASRPSLHECCTRSHRRCASSASQPLKHDHPARHPRSAAGVTNTLAAHGLLRHDGSSSVGGIKVVEAPGKGIGLTATRAFGRGETVLDEVAFAAVAPAVPRALAGKARCSQCLALPMSATGSAAHSSDAGDDDADDELLLCPSCGLSFCCSACRAAADASWHAVLCGADGSGGACATLDDARHSMRRHPLLVLRMTLDSLVHPTMDLEAYWSCVSTLCTSYDASEGVLEAPPADTLSDSDYYQLLVRDVSARVGGDVSTLFAQVLTPHWYATLMGVVQLNSFRVSLPGAAVAAPAAGGHSQSGSSDSEAGTALFMAASLLNHDCDPSLAVSFAAPRPTRASSAVPLHHRRGPRVSCVATRDIAPGDELTITYIDAGQARTEEQRAADLAPYGFVCRCARCVAERSG